MHCQSRDELGIGDTNREAKLLAREVTPRQQAPGNQQEHEKQGQSRTPEAAEAKDKQTPVHAHQCTQRTGRTRAEGGADSVPRSVVRATLLTVSAFARVFFALLTVCLVAAGLVLHAQRRSAVGVGTASAAAGGLASAPPMPPILTPTGTPHPIHAVEAVLTERVTLVSMPSDTPPATPTRPPRATSTAVPIAPTATAASTPTPPAPSSTPAVAGPTPLPRQAAPGTTAHCVILTYHYFKASEPFASQLAALKTSGYEVVPLEQLVQYVKGDAGVTLPDRCVVLTFDDGWRTQFRFARPVLLAAHVPATFFVITTYADQSYPAYMTWAMIEQLHSDGFDIEDHTRTHPRLELLGQRSVAALTDEIAGSLQDLEAHVGPTQRIFNYPYGAYDRRVVQVVARYYDAAVQLAGSGVQRSAERYLLHRVMVDANAPASQIIAMAHALEAH